MKNDIKKNGSGYYDPTAFEAIINAGGGKEHGSIQRRYILY